MQISYLCTMEQALNFISNQGLSGASNTNYENNIKLYRLAAHDKICRYLGYEVVSSTYTDELYSSKGGLELFLNNRPITEVTQVKVNDIEDTSTFVIVDGKLLYNELGFQRGIYNYKISYTAGWTQASMPADIRFVALQLIALYQAQIGGGGTTIGKSSYSDGNGGSESIDVDAESRLLESLSSYQKIC